MFGEIFSLGGLLNQWVETCLNLNPDSPRCAAYGPSQALPKPRVLAAPKKAVDAAARQAKAASLEALMQWTSKLQHILPPEAGKGPRVLDGTNDDKLQRNRMRTRNSEESFEVLELWWLIRQQPRRLWIWQDCTARSDDKMMESKSTRHVTF